jgi:osmotically-inducible protein OsmY
MTGTRHRSDADIFSATRKALDDHPAIPHVRVHVDRGTVTLTGSVRWPQERSEAEAVVCRIEGVLGIANTITVAHVVDPEGFEAPDESR